MVLCLLLVERGVDDYPAVLSHLFGVGVETVPDTHASPDADDTELMALLADGDRLALAELVHRHQRGVLELAYRTTGDRVLAEDIAQDAFIRVWRSAGRYKPTARFSTWLYRIVVNLCLDAFRKQKAGGGDLVEAPDPRTEDPARALERDDRAAAVRRAVAALPQRQRVAVVLQRFSGLPIRGIAEVTGWTESAVESLLVRAHAALRESLSNLRE
ncbi:MAG: sigma-70 family RNA polymerase sigma factor [Phycisphaerae bacterium]|nr:sigma-70 family RNA polymerase sigma factor [Phycisphaerae bacterium]